MFQKVYLQPDHVASARPKGGRGDQAGRATVHWAREEGRSASETISFPSDTLAPDLLADTSFLQTSKLVRPLEKAEADQAASVAHSHPEQGGQ